jgi:excinuclease ABC subunit C
MAIADKLRGLPNGPGCYLHRDGDGRVIYIGKAKNLRNRVRSYFQDGRGDDMRMRDLVVRIEDFDYIATDTESEALILETNLIKQHKPPFNVLLKDDKQYPHIKVTNEPFPRAIVVRRIARDGAAYFGPFLPASRARQAVDLVNRLFMLRTCQIEIDGRLDRPCLEYHIKRCLGPCVKGLCTKAEYDEAVADVKALLSGHGDSVAASLRERMAAAAEELRYEVAARYRDQIRTVERLAERQKIMQLADSDIDIFGCVREGPRLALMLFTMREGMVVGKREFYWEDIDEPFELGSFLGAALAQYYTGADYAPAEIHVAAEPVDREMLEEFLRQRRGARVRIRVPKRGDARRLLELVTKNARLKFEQRFRLRHVDGAKVLADLQEALELSHLPRRIECFDISHLQGAETVASMVVCLDGQMCPSEYRKFRIRTVEGIDDFASMYEVVHRRYGRLLNDGGELPKLVMIDGGKGQLSAAARALRDLELEALPVVALAKREETLFLKGREDEPIRLEAGDAGLRLVQHIRDEAHRFAVTYHRKRRELRDFHSAIQEIPGVGPKKRDKLLRDFGSLQRVAEASVEELEPFVGRALAQRILEYLRRGDTSAYLAEPIEDL